MSLIRSFVANSCLRDLVLSLFPAHLPLSLPYLFYFLQYIVTVMKSDNKVSLWFREVLQHFTPEKKKEILVLDWSTNVCNALVYFGFVRVGGINMPQKTVTQPLTDNLHGQHYYEGFWFPEITAIDSHECVASHFKLLQMQTGVGTTVQQYWSCCLSWCPQIYGDERSGRIP